MLSITKIFEFAYAHTLPNYAGKCKNLHGHNASLEIEITPSPEDFPTSYEGMVFDFGDLQKIVGREVIDKLDHTYLNDLIPIPTAENTVLWIRDSLIDYFGEGLVRVRMYETSNSYAEWRREPN